MINSKQDYLYYIEADRIAKSIPKKRSFLSLLKGFFYPNIWEFQKLLRKCEYYSNCKKGFFCNLYKTYIYFRFKNVSTKLGFSIPINVFGPGLSIAHVGTIIVSGNAKVGANCRLHACTNIGTEAGYTDRAPVIGDNCYIGPGVKMFGEIELKDGMVIGANAVVTKSFETSSSVLLGIPAKIIKEIDSFDFLIPATLIIDGNLNRTDKYIGIPAKDLNSMLKLKINKSNK